MEKTLHELKVHKQYFYDLVKGTKSFELRKNDRGFKVGDFLKLNLFDTETQQLKEQFTMYAEVVYLLEKCPQFGLIDGYCIMSIVWVSEDYVTKSISH